MVNFAWFLKFSLIVTLVWCQIVEFDVLVSVAEGSKTLVVDIRNDNIMDKVSLFVKQYTINSGAGCIEDQQCVINKLIDSVEHRAVEILMNINNFNVNKSPVFSTILSENETLFSKAGWHAAGNPHLSKTPLLEIEARSNRRLQKYRDYISLFDKNASIVLNRLRTQIKKQLSHQQSKNQKQSNHILSEYECLDIEDKDDEERESAKFKRDEGVVLAIGIISAPNHLAHRMAMRQTWLADAYRTHGHSVTHKFFIGISYHEQPIYEENKKSSSNEHVATSVREEEVSVGREIDVQTDEYAEDTIEILPTVGSETTTTTTATATSMTDAVAGGEADDTDVRDGPILSEALAFGDIGLLHLEDHYLSTPRKVIALFLWGIEQCGAYYVLRSNDDVYIRIQDTLELLSKHPPTNLMMGLFIHGNSMNVPRPEQFHSTQEALYKNHKVWTFTYQDYPSNRFPDFFQGNGLILSRDFGYEISEKSRQSWFTLMADDIMIALILSKFYAQANKLKVKVDYEFEGLYTKCSNDALWHFNIHPEHMYDLFHNDVLGRAPCAGDIIRFCCG